MRRLGPGDEEVVRRLSIDDGRAPHTIESAREFLTVPESFQLAAFSDGEPVGQLLAYELGGRRDHDDEVVVDFDWS